MRRIAARDASHSGAACVAWRRGVRRMAARRASHGGAGCVAWRRRMRRMTAQDALHGGAGCVAWRRRMRRMTAQDALHGGAGCVAWRRGVRRMAARDASHGGAGDVAVDTGVSHSDAGGSVAARGCRGVTRRVRTCAPRMCQRPPNFPPVWPAKNPSPERRFVVRWRTEGCEEPASEKRHCPKTTGCALSVDRLPSANAAARFVDQPSEYLQRRISRVVS